MQIAALLRENKQPLMEGGNLSIGSHEAEHLDLKVTQRSYMVPKLNELLNSINRAFYAMHKAPLWSAETLKSGQFLSGSSLHFFNVAGIEDDTFYQKKPTVGDIDTMVDKRLEHILQTFLTEATNKKIGEATFLGFQKGNEQFSGLFELQDPPVKVQIDFEFVEFQNGAPTDWARFSHSSSWEDIQQGVKGVFHKWLIQSLTSLTRKPFLLRKMTGRGAMRKEEDVPMTDNMFSFAVSSKEGGGLRSKYEPVINPATNKPLMKGNLPVMKALPASGYEQDIGKIFTTILGKRLDPKTLKQVSQNFWSFTGLAQLINKIASPEDKQQILLGFLEKTIGKGSQGLYKNNPDKDIKEKTTAINYLVKTLGIKLPAEYTQMLSDYKANYKMTSLTEAGPNYKRQGIPHIYKPGSTVELKDADFIQLCTEIQSEGGKLEGVPINLKVDGAGIRFGKDEQGRPFFMTSKVTEPKYLENVGDFERYGQSIGQDPERLAFTKKYDDAMKAILTAPFMKVVPNDTIVQAEMMYTPMAQQEEGGLKFVNIAYDPSKLGKVMTLVPFMFKQFSTGQVRPDSAKIKEALLNSSNPNIKMVNNNLQHKGIDVSKIVAPVVKNADVLLRAVKERGMTPAKEKAKSVLNAARQQLSNAIINGPIPGKDQLGDTIEGLVVNMPSGLLVKVTSDAMANKMATKMAARQATPAGGQRPAVVAVGSAIGHVGHQQLFNYAIQLAQKVKGQPFMFIGPAEGKDDPIPPAVKVQTWHKLYPELANNISTVTQEGGSLLQKIKHELISPQPGKPPKFDTIYIVVGSDRQDMAENWSKTLMKAVNKFPGYENVKVSPYVTPRESNAGGTGISGTLLRNVLKDQTKTPEQKFEVWNNAYNSGNYGAQKLTPEWIEQLMSIASKGMGMNQEQVREFFEKIKPLLKEASPEKQKEMLQRLSEMKNVAKLDENRIMDRNALINAYYVSTKGDRHRVAERIPYYLLDKLVGLLTKKYNITMHDIEVRPADKNQYRRTSQPEMAEAYDHNAPFNAADFNRHMEQLRAREELRKTDPMRALVGDLIDKEHEKEALAKKKKPQDDSSIDINDPRHPGWGALHNTMDEGMFDVFKKKQPKVEVPDPGSYPRIGSDIAQWMRDAVEYHKATLPDSLWKLFCPSYPDYLPTRVRVGTSEKTIRAHLGDYVQLRDANPEAKKLARQNFEPNHIYPNGPREDYQNQVAEGAPELLKAEMPLVRHIEQGLAQHGYVKGTEEYKKVFDHMLSYYRKFGNFNPSQLDEFAPNDDGDNGQEDIFFKYAKLWYNGNEQVQQRIIDILDKAGWEIGEIESEEGGAFIVQAGDEDGGSYMGWSAQELEGLDETKVSKYKDLGATKDTTHFIKNVTTGEIISPHRGKQDAEDALVAHYRGPSDGNEYKIVRARKDVEEGLKSKLAAAALGAGMAASAPGAAVSVAGAIPTPSHQQAMYKAAADSNRAEAKRQAELKAKADAERLEKNTEIVDREQRVNHHLIPTNEVSDKTLVGYLKGVEADARKHKSDPTKRSPEKASKSVKGFQTAFNKLDARKPDGSISEDYLDE